MADGRFSQLTALFIQVAKASLKLGILRPQPPESLGYGHVPLCPALLVHVYYLGLFHGAPLPWITARGAALLLCRTPAFLQKPEIWPRCIPELLWESIQGFGQQELW